MPQCREKAMVQASAGACSFILFVLFCVCVPAIHPPPSHLIDPVPLVPRRSSKEDAQVGVGWPVVGRVSLVVLQRPRAEGGGWGQLLMCYRPIAAGGGRGGLCGVGGRVCLLSRLTHMSIELWFSKTLPCSCPIPHSKLILTWPWQPRRFSVLWGLDGCRVGTRLGGGGESCAQPQQKKCGIMWYYVVLCGNMW